VIQDEVRTEARDKMRKSVEHLRDELGRIRTGRANPALLERIMVDYYGTEVPLQQIAGFSVPDARLLQINPYDANSITAIERAIQESDLGLTPSNDGKLIRLQFPQLTEERRKEFVKLARTRAEEARVAVRNIRRQARADLEEFTKEGEMSEDDLVRAEKELEKLTHEEVEEIDGLLKRKEDELMEV
jgi:ribosome recycling factor